MIDFGDSAYRRDPHTALARLRAEAPLARHPDGFWIATRYADVRAFNRDPRFGRDLRKLGAAGGGLLYDRYPTLRESHETGLFHLDPPDHTRIRRLVAQAFTPAAVAELSASIEAVADALLARLPESGSIELIQDLAKPFPVAVVANLLGVPERDFGVLEEWSFAISAITELSLTRGQLRRAEAAAAAFKAYLATLVEERTRRPGRGLVDRLLAARQHTEALSQAELLHNIMLLFVAGHETTTNLIGNTVMALLEHPGELARLRADPSLVPLAIEEGLRYESPANATPRCALEDVEVGTIRIRRGELVMCMLGAANRDPAAFADPDRLDITRNPNPHESFGGGIHYCVGAPLARVEGRVLLGKLLARYGMIALDRQRVAWQDRFNLRGLAQLGLHVGP